jgi:hypothetical protein
MFLQRETSTLLGLLPSGAYSCQVSVHHYIEDDARPAAHAGPPVALVQGREVMRVHLRRPARVEATFLLTMVEVEVDQGTK